MEGILLSLRSLILETFLERVAGFVIIMLFRRFVAAASLAGGGGLVAAYAASRAQLSSSVTPSGSGSGSALAEAILALDGSVRFVRAVSTFALVSLDYKLLKSRWKRPSSDSQAKWRNFTFDSPEEEQRYKAERTAVHLRSANRLLNVCKLHGGLYTKLGQYVATMNHVLPSEYTQTLAQLQDHAPARPYEEIIKVVAKELKRSGGDELQAMSDDDVVSQHFSQFDKAPIGAASLAQVHKATTAADGKRVAVKIQYPNLPVQVAGDFATFRALAFAIPKMFPDFEFGWMIPEFEATAEMELDFCQEMRNADRVRNMFEEDDHVIVPQCLPELSTSRMLTMDFMEGDRLDKTDAMEKLGLNRKDVAKSVLGVFSHMVFLHGFCHCDPHPGNLLLRKSKLDGKPELVVLDHGMYRRVENHFRYNFCLLWKALVTRDDALGRQATADLGVPRGYDLLSLMLTFRLPDSESPLGGKLTLEDRKQLIEKFRGKDKLTAGDFNSFMEALPRDMLFVLRTLNIVRSLNKSLGGFSAERFDAMSQSMLRGLALEGDVGEMRDQSSAAKMRETLNEPVASEIFKKRKSWFDSLALFFKFLYLRLNLFFIRGLLTLKDILHERKKRSAIINGQGKAREMG